MKPSPLTIDVVSLHVLGEQVFRNGEGSIAKTVVRVSFKDSNGKSDLSVDLDGPTLRGRGSTPLATSSLVDFADKLPINDGYRPGDAEDRKLKSGLVVPIVPLAKDLRRRKEHLMKPQLMAYLVLVGSMPNCVVIKMDSEEKAACFPCSLTFLLRHLRKGQCCSLALL